MSNVPTNLIPTRITGLPEYTGDSTLGFMPYVLEGRTYKVQFSNIAAVGAVPSSRVIATGNGLEGGGDLSQNRTISIISHGVGYAQLSYTGVVAGTYGSANTIPAFTVDATGRITSVTDTPIVLSNYVPTSRTITAGPGLTGGGQLSGNLTISLNPSNATPQSLGAAFAGTGTQAARDDHVHPAVDLTDTSETQGVLPLGRGGTGVALSPVVGAVIYADNDSLNQTTAGNSGQVLTSAGGSGAPYWQTITGTGTVTDVSVATANGFAGTVADPSTTPEITLSTTVSGMVKGDGTALSAAVAGTDYVAPGAVTTSGLTMATARLLGRTTAATGAVEEITVGTGLSLSAGSLVNSAPDQVVSLTGGGTTVITGTYPNFTITSNDAYTGTVTSVAASGGTTGLTFSGSPITTSGTLTLGGTLAVASGGTGATTAAGARTNLGLGTAAVLNAGVANGVATLDSGGTVPTSQLPAAVLGALNYQGTWNASTNTPTLTSSVGTKGYYYVVSVAGSTNLDGVTDWLVGDWAVYNGSVWQKIDNTDSVTSVNGYTGAVVLSYSDVGAPSTSGTGATGTWGINISGNAATATNGVVTTGSYADPSWITSLAASKLTGTVAIANGGTGATTAAGARTNLGAAASGANSDITSLSGITGAISSPTYIQYGNGSGTTLAAGRMWYDQTTGSMNVGMGGGNITQQIGEELFVYGKASAAITEGQVVVKTGAVGASGVITFAPAPLGTTDSQAIIGVATENIALNGFGRITAFGVVHGIDTTGSAYGETWADGDTLYYNPAYVGGLTKVKPSAPNQKTEVGIVINAGSGGSGSLQVDIIHGTVLGGTDSNVQLTSPTDNDLLQYYAAGPYWRNLAPSSVSVGTATNLAGGAANRIAYQTGAGATGFITAPSVANTFLEWSGSAFQWSANPLGTVTSVAASGGTTGLTFSGSPITTSGTLTLGGTLNVANGGTGATTLSSGYLVKGNGTSAVSASVVYDDGTNVGIGTASPFNRLAVLGPNEFSLGISARVSSTQTGLLNHPVMALQNSSAVAGNGVGLRYQIADTGGNFRTAGGIGTVATAKDASSVTADMYFYTGASEKMRITSAGNVGIGTSSPAQRLDVNGQTITGNITVRGDASEGGQIIFNNAANTGSPLVLDVDATGNGRLFTAANNANLALGQLSGTGGIVTVSTAGSERMRIDSSGNVGIGKTPTTTLNILGSSNPSVDVDYYENGTGGASYRGRKARGTASAPSAVAAGDYLSTLLASGYGDTSFGGNIGLIGFRANQTFTDTARGTNLVFENTPDGTNSRTERMRITSAGNVGIGTSSPGYKLDVVAADTTANLGYAMRLRHNTTANAATIQFTDDPVSVQYAVITSSTSEFTLRSGSTRPFTVWTNGAERARIDSSGSLLVGKTSASGLGEILGVNRTSDGTTAMIGRNGGTTNPYARFIATDTGCVTTIDANGSAGTPALALSANSSEIMRLADGNVAVGTTSANSFRTYVKQSSANQAGLAVAASAATTETRIFNDGTLAGVASSYSGTASFLPLTFWTSDAERARFDASGNFLINATTVVDRVTLTGGMALTWADDSKFWMNYSNDYRMGMRLNANDRSTTIFATTATPGDGGFIAFNIRGGAGSSATDYGTERMRIANSGYVGIGTTTPASPLTVAGVIESTSGGVKFPDGTTQTSAAGGAMVLISTSSPSAASEVTFTGLSSTYAYYIIEFNTSSGNVSRVQLSANNGSSWLATNYYSNDTVFGTSTVTQTGASAQTYISLGGSSFGGVIKFINPTSATDGGSVVISETTGLTTSSYRANGRHVSGGNNAIRIYPSSGTVTGTFKLYGVKA